jgi:subtilisin family serine protease
VQHSDNTTLPSRQDGFCDVTEQNKIEPASSILVEARMPSAMATVGFSTGNRVKFPGFGIDQRYPFVPLKPSTPPQEISLVVAHEQLVLIRGTIAPNRIDDLRAAPRVVDVFSDSALSPFGNPYGLPHCDDWLLDVALRSPTDCPIPPCDCEPTQPRGCLLEVAEHLGADQIWQDGVNGEGVVIGIVDGGILAEGRTDPNLPGVVPRVTDGWPKGNWGTIAGWRGHGNMSAIDALGMAPQASIYDIRIADSCQHAGRMSDAIAGIHWALEKFRATGTPQILCCGWGIYQHADDPRYALEVNHPLTRKIVEAMDEGILVLFAAGNGGQCCPATWCAADIGPGKSIWGANGHPRVMTVGAVNKDEQLVGYSSQGPAALAEYKPDFCAISHFAGYFCSDSGTSAACAVAAGVVALLKQTRPMLNQEVAMRLLKSTAKDVGPPGWDRHSGSGIIQPKMAYDKLLGRRALDRGDLGRLERLEMENRCLRELFIELALERQMRRDGAAKHAAPDNWAFPRRAGS